MLILRGLLPYPRTGLVCRLIGLFVCPELVNRLAVLGQAGPEIWIVTILGACCIPLDRVC